MRLKKLNLIFGYQVQEFAKKLKVCRKLNDFYQELITTAIHARVDEAFKNSIIKVFQLIVIKYFV